jgi:hypothetical protein
VLWTGPPATPLAVGGKQQHTDPEQTEDHKMHGAVDRDQAQHDPVAQALAAGGEDDLVAPRGGEVPRSRLGPGQRHPGVAAQTAVPAHVSALADHERVLIAYVSGIPADERVAAHAAHDQLPVELATSPGKLGSRGGQEVRRGASGHLRGC